MIPAFDVVSFIRNNILFSEFESDEFLQSIAEKLERKSIKALNPLKTLYRQGDNIDGLYLIISGQVEVYTERDGVRYTLSHAQENHLVGEFLLMSQSVRSTSAEILQDTDLLFLSLIDVHALLEEFPEQILPLRTKIVNRLCWNQTTLALRLCHLFVDLDEKIVRQLINELEIRSIPSNTFLYRRNEISDDLCIVIDGQFQVKRPTASGHENITVVGRGESIGEMGVISQSPRILNVLAIRDSTIARLSRQAYERILLAYPMEINQAFVKSIINQLTKHEKNQAKSTETFVLAVLSANLSKAKVVQQLFDALSEYGLTAIISSRSIDFAFSKKGVAQSSFQDDINHSLLQWISEQEIAHRYVIFITDDSMTPWTTRCLRQADQVLLIVDADDNVDIQPLEREILNELDNKELKKTLLINHFNPDDAPTNSSRWLKLRNLNMHHHLRDGNKADFDRVARFLTGNTIGVVLGGGGARGFAHIGVIRAFHELNIPIDLVGGNSMGALIAAQYAMQWSYQEMIDKTQKLCLQGDKLTLPMMSLFSGKKMTKGLLKMFGDRCIEDLWLHFFSVSCNISRATLMTHKNGSLLAAVLNSNTPPGLFPPQIVDGDLLVDGALLNNVPVDVMAKYNAGGIIFAIDVNAREDLLDNTGNTGGISGWYLLLNKLNPFAKNIKIPSMIDILSRASIIGGLAQRKKLMEGVADLYIQPPVNEFSLMAYKDAKKIEQVGYRYAKQELQRWLNENGEIKHFEK